jgi:hypothetical protein
MPIQYITSKAAQSGNARAAESEAAIAASIVSSTGGDPVLANGRPKRIITVQIAKRIMCSI